MSTEIVTEPNPLRAFILAQLRGGETVVHLIEDVRISRAAGTLPAGGRVCDEINALEAEGKIKVDTGNVYLVPVKLVKQSVLF